jgi:AAA family ATP:ADP antiporter
MNDTRPSIIDRVLKIFSDVRAGESITVLLLFIDLFLLLFGYYLLKTVREPLVLVSSERDLQILLSSNLPEWLVNVLKVQKGPQLKAAASACQAVLFIGFVPLYSWFASKVKRLYFLIGVTGFFISNIILFYLASLAGVLFLGFIFYIWVGIFSVAMVAQFWSFCNDIYPRSAGERLFPIIAIGATAGSPLGSKIAELLSDLPAFQIILLTSGILIIYLGISLVVHFREAHSSQMRKNSAEHEEIPLKKGGGFALVFRNPYTLLLAFLILLLNFVNTGGENILSEVVMSAARAVSPDNMSVFVQEFYGNFFFWVNIIAFLVQALLVSRIVKYTGMKGILLILPIVAFGAYGLIAFGVGLATIRWLKTAENASDYSIMNTGKAMLWLPTSREEKYKAKQTVDTFFVRFGDLAAAVLFIVGTTLLGFGLRELAGVNLFLIVIWIIITGFVLKYHAKLVRQQNIEMS